MFETAATALYHTNGQPAKGLFSNITIPSSLPTHFLQNSFIMFPLALFGQQTEQPEVTSTTTTLSPLDSKNHGQNIPITPPTPAPLSSPLSPSQTTAPPVNKRLNQRRNKVGNSASAAIVAQAGNMNFNAMVPSSGPHQNNQSQNNTHNTRRKRLSNRMNRNLIDQAITFSAIAVEEDQQGNHQCALDLYLTALESMLYAMPIHTDNNRKAAVEEKLREFINSVGFAEDFLQTPPASNNRSLSISLNGNQTEHNGMITAYPNGGRGLSCGVDNPTPAPSISQHIINAAITSAVALKQSPIPDAISATVNYTMKKVKQIDETYGLQEKAWEISRTGINMALEIDQQYNVHEKVGNAIFTGLAAAMKAGIAYKDSPSYQELKRMKSEYQTLVK
ncbi:hypothetical protein G9A89_018215 [Geosiphon pyriformis]|nr:hypothetical protein G9A89_018215 [Geosiphon pyriformis]